ncbi:MAG: response regulator [Bacillota bacterium]
MDYIKIIIVDDHPLIREGIRKILSLEPRILVVGEAGDGLQGLELARKHSPDVILMDINMPRMNGIEAARLIRQEMPEVQIIALTIHDDQAYVVETIRAGANGYILKDVDVQDLIRSVLSVADGHSVIHPVVTGKVFGELRRKTAAPSEEREPLTDREMEVLSHIARGEPNKLIAGRLCISEKTVKNHISSIFRKLGVSDRTQAALYAVKHRMVHL